MTTDKYKKAFENLVAKLENIEQSDYMRNLHPSLFSLWLAELTEAKKQIKEDKNRTELCTSFGTQDLFDVPIKDELEP